MSVGVPPRDETARIVAGLLMSVGLLGVAYNALAWWHAVCQTHHQADVRASLGYAMTASLFALTAIVGVGIASGRGWAKPWILATSLLTLGMSLWPPSIGWKVILDAFVMFRVAPHAQTMERLLYLAVPPLTACIALGWLAYRARSLPSTSRLHWGAAVLWIGVMIRVVFVG
jgi:hypothetical protein